MDKKKVRLSELNRTADKLDSELGEWRRLNDRYVNVRLITFVAATFVSAVTLLSAGVGPWLAVSVIALLPFILTVRGHRQIESRIIRSEILLNLKRIQIARMNLDWDVLPEPLKANPGPEHPYASDLDLVGYRSLHQLLDTAVSREGSQRLCDWLLDTSPDGMRIADRQACVRELSSLPGFCEQLALNATMIPSQSSERWPGQRLLDWLVAHQEATSLRSALQLLAPLALINITLGLLYAVDVLGPWWMFTWLLYVALSFLHVRKVGNLFEDAFFLHDGLERLGRVFGFLEVYDYAGNQQLRRLCQPFTDAEERPSQLLGKITRVVAAAGLKKNQMFWLLLNVLVPWDIYFAYRLSQSKRELSTLLPQWLDIWFELEALSSLAGFAYLNPSAVFPELDFAHRPQFSKPPLFAAKGLGHPLLRDEQRVCNDIIVKEPGTIFLVTGSNMSGKSTFLRTVGINMVLAYAGGVVIAESLQLSLFRLFAAVEVTDSVVDGISYFYAEVRRLKALLGELERESQLPLLYLIDEIFRGTNNRERLIGSRAYIKELAGGNGVGFIATHDLELVNLADEIHRVHNYHFRDDVQDGRMIFDYKLHPGPCPTTNALKIMQQAGLPTGTET